MWYCSCTLPDALVAATKTETSHRSRSVFSATGSCRKFVLFPHRAILILASKEGVMSVEENVVLMRL